MEISGELIVVKPIQEINDKFSKREFVIKTIDSYPQEIQLELHGQAVDLIDSYNIGETIKCQLNLKGRRYEKPMEDTKWFNTIQSWKIERA